MPQIHLSENPTQSYSDLGLFAVDTSAVTSTVPEPVTLALLGTGLFGLGFARRRKTA